jgi:hypothetical protein
MYKTFLPSLPALDIKPGIKQQLTSDVCPEQSGFTGEDKLRGGHRRRCSRVIFPLLLVVVTLSGSSASRPSATTPPPKPPSMPTPAPRGAELPASTKAGTRPRSV